MRSGRGCAWGGRDFVCRSCVYPWGWPPLLYKCHFITIFLSLLVLKLGVAELVLKPTDLGGVRYAVDTQMPPWDVLFPERGWSGSSKNTISSKISPFPPG